MTQDGHAVQIFEEKKGEVELPLQKNFSFSGSKSGGILKYTWFLWPDRPKEPKKVKEEFQ